MRISSSTAPATAASAACAALSMQGLRQHYGQLLAVDDISLQVPRGQIVGLLGPKGAMRTGLLAHRSAESVV